MLSTNSLCLRIGGKIMHSLLLQPNSTAQWHALVSEAEKDCAIHLKDELEAYLVFLLIRFINQPNLASSLLGLEFLLGIDQQIHSQHYNSLKDVGDKCLLFAGLFPNRAVKKRVKVSYFVKLGQAAYSTLSTHFSAQEALFIQLCLEFPRMMDVLNAMRKTQNSADNLLQSLELWHETGSQAAWRRLCDASKGLPMIPQNKKSIH